MEHLKLFYELLDPEGDGTTLLQKSLNINRSIYCNRRLCVHVSLTLTYR
jgi:hypothetical protein